MNTTSQPLKLLQYRHPDKLSGKKFDSLVGIDGHKEDLLSVLQSILDGKGLSSWIKKHHSGGLPYIEGVLTGDSLIILSGDVGCGKTELAHSIGTPLSKAMGGETIILFETPSDIRGGGHVGEVSLRITAAFDFAKNSLKKGEYGILLIDEGDDLATSREQTQAHHEDRSGVNVLIKEIDKVQREKINLAVILITNRPDALDAAVLRRASLHLEFQRPNETILMALVKRVFDVLEFEEEAFKEIIVACNKNKTKYTYSDITKRIAKQSIISAWKLDTPLTKEIILGIIRKTKPSPGITNKAK
jgi:AAA+ superfamily predicted ATPase